jgi:hypothetical protein
MVDLGDTADSYCVRRPQFSGCIAKMLSRGPDGLHRDQNYPRSIIPLCGVPLGTFRTPQEPWGSALLLMQHPG